MDRVTKVMKQMLIDEVGAIGLRQSLERTVRHMSQRLGGLLKTSLRIFFESAEFALETVVRSSAVCGEYNGG
jgi:hypothetical protein